jgi:hypothetical protein
VFNKSLAGHGQMKNLISANKQKRLSKRLMIVKYKPATHQ